MKVGIDARMYSPKFTGIGRYVYELAHNLFTIDDENEYVLFLNNPEYKAFKCPNKRIKKVLVNSPHYSFAEQTRFLKALYKEKLDLMHFTHFNAPILYRRPSIVTIHDLTLSFFPGNKMNSPIYRRGYEMTLNSAVKKAKSIIAVSENTKKDLQKLTQTPAEKIQVIYEGVNPEFKVVEDEERLYRCQLNYNLNRPFLLYTGVWRSHKNLLNLLKAFHILRNDFQLDYYLVITGRPDPHYPEIHQETLSLQIENDIIFPGLIPDDDLICLYNAATAYVMPSLYEGFCLPVLEAMACETPVVCSNTSCLPEICGEGNALFFDPKSPRDIAAKLYEVCTSSEIRSKLVTNGLNRVKQFSWKKMAQETLDLYKKTLQP